MKSYLFWITGLSGSGKTTFASLLMEKFKQASIPTVFVDGDVIREIFGDDKRYDRDSRLELAYKYSKLCSFLVAHNINVVCSTISLFHEVQEWNRLHIENYYEIFIKRDLEKLIQEDNKGIYKGVVDGKIENVVGVDIVPEYPFNPEMVVNNVDKSELGWYVAKVFEFYRSINRS